MDFQTIQDLIPHKESLAVLYRSEEFQPLASFLSSIRKQKELEIFNMQGVLTVKKEEPDLMFKVCTSLLQLITQRNSIAMIESLPTVITDMESQMKLQEAAKAAYVKSQE